MLNMEEVISLLKFCGAGKIGQPKGSKINFCCPIHGESNPSCGIDIDYTPLGTNERFQVFHCFSCGSKGTLNWLVYKSLPDQFKSLKEANRFLKDRYGVSYNYSYDPATMTIKRYEDFYNEVIEPRHEIPLSKLAPFKSGRETYQYFFDRGFERKDVKDYMIGRDLNNETVTVPVFWENHKLAGVIGRYIDPKRPKNSRFKVYDFPKSSLIYPLDKLYVVNDTIIVAESIFDVIMLRKWGYVNAVAIMGNEISRKQADMIAERCKKIITLFDNDTGGDTARDTIERLLLKKVNIYHPTEYPNTGKDPLDWGERFTRDILMSAQYCGVRAIQRLT